MSTTDPLLTVRELATRIGAPEWYVRKLLRGENPLPSYRAGGVRIRLSEFEAWLETRRRV